MQDIEEDKKSGSQTIMVRAAAKGKLEEVLNRLFHYTKQIFMEFTPVNDRLKIFMEFAPVNDRLKTFMEENCYTMLIHSAISKKDYLSKDYIEKLELFFPVHVKFLQKQSKLPEKSEEKTKKLFDQYIEALL